MGGGGRDFTSGGIGVARGGGERGEAGPPLASTSLMLTKIKGKLLQGQGPADGARTLKHRNGRYFFLFGFKTIFTIKAQKIVKSYLTNKIKPINRSWSIQYVELSPWRKYR